MFHPLLTKTPHRCINAAILTLLSSCLTSLTTDATLPPEPPKGVSVLNSNGRALRQGILTNCNVDMISVDYDWDLLEPSEGDYHFTDYIDPDLNTISTNGHGQAVLLRINTMGGCAPTGKTPPWVFTAMGQSDCTCDVNGCTVTPGVTYSFFDDPDQIWRLIPVFWDPTYLAKKKALIAMAGAYITANPQFSSQVQVVAISYANAITEDWNVPHDGTEVDLWLQPPPDGAGYTTQKMIDAAIHQADATFTDGVVSGTTLTSASAVFTQADVGCTIVVGPTSSRGNAHIASWISPTQVRLDRPVLGGIGRRFTIKNRRDGLIDVAMAAFPNQYITTAENSNGPTLDLECTGYDAGICLAETVNHMAWTVYSNRYIVQRNNVTAIIPTKDVATDAWVILADAADAGRPTAGQALSNCYKDTTYQMNGGDNCNHEDPNCAPTPTPTPTPTPCMSPCAISYQQELDFSGEHIATYSASYYEVYYLDAGAANLCLANLHALLNPDVICGPCSP
jgi:hypothetical protein